VRKHIVIQRPISTNPKDPLQITMEEIEGDFTIITIIDTGVFINSTTTILLMDDEVEQLKVLLNS
jgi:hypothetical protein